MAHSWEENGELYVDFGAAKRSHSKFKAKALTEYEGVDLASGYSKDLIWVTRDGRRIAIPNLADDHLINIIGYLRSRVGKYKKQICAKFILGTLATILSFEAADTPDDVVDSFSMEMSDRLNEIMGLNTDEFLRKVFPIYSKLYQEAYKRKLVLPTLTTKPDGQAIQKVSQFSSGIEPLLNEKYTRKVKGPTEIGRRYQKKPQPTFDEEVEEMAKAARECDGIEVHHDNWGIAAGVVAKYGNEFTFDGPARGPDRKWKRLYLIGSDDDGS